MRRVRLTVCAAALWLFALIGPVWAQETTTTLDPALAGGVVSGTVTIDGLPAADACVSITDGETVALGTTVTDPIGGYEFTNLYTGDLWVWVSDCVVAPPRFEAPAPVESIVVHGGVHAVIDFALASLPAPTSTTTTVAEVATVSTTSADPSTPTSSPASLEVLPVTGAETALVALVAGALLAAGLAALGSMVLGRSKNR